MSLSYREFNATHLNKVVIEYFHYYTTNKRGFFIKYFVEAKHLWKSFVPKQGQSETVQGELIRAIEKLRDEAQRNGNGNWDSCFEMFCDFLEINLCNSGVFSMLQKMKIKSNIKRLRKFNSPYLEDDIYDDLTDRVVEWYFKNQEPIFKPYDPNQYR